jgi:hypothetical protein
VSIKRKKARFLSGSGLIQTPNDTCVVVRALVNTHLAGDWRGSPNDPDATFPNLNEKNCQFEAENVDIDDDRCSKCAASREEKKLT